jgi:hypothetical protein
MNARFDSCPTNDDITSDEARAMERAYWQRLRMADDYAEYCERQADAMAEEMGEEDGGDEPPTPPAAPLLRARKPVMPLWAVLLSGSAGRVGQTKVESREARRRRRAELDRAA